jgi:hypothetical protein
MTSNRELEGVLFFVFLQQVLLPNKVDTVLLPSRVD